MFILRQQIFVECITQSLGIFGCSPHLLIRLSFTVIEVICIYVCAENVNYQGRNLNNSTLTLFICLSIYAFIYLTIINHFIEHNV